MNTINFQKRPILVSINNPTFIRKEATEKNNEVTIVIMHMAIPLEHIFNGKTLALSPSVLTAAAQVSSGFQDINLEFNNNIKAPAFTFQVKAKTERRGNDVPNQALADKIAVAKANAKACVIARRLLLRINKYYRGEMQRLDSIADVFSNYAARELSYIQKA